MRHGAALKFWPLTNGGSMRDSKRNPRRCSRVVGGWVSKLQSCPRSSRLLKLWSARFVFVWIRPMTETAGDGKRKQGTVLSEVEKNNVPRPRKVTRSLDRGDHKRTRSRGPANLYSLLTDPASKRQDNKAVTMPTGRRGTCGSTCATTCDTLAPTSQSCTTQRSGFGRRCRNKTSNLVEWRDLHAEYAYCQGAAVEFSAGSMGNTSGVGRHT